VSRVFIAMVSRSPMAPSVSATQPMVFSHSMGMNPFVFSSGRIDHDTQSIPWASNHLSRDILDMSSHFPSSASPSYVNTSFGSGGMMLPYSTFSFDGSHVHQLTLIVGGWNLTSHRPNPSFAFPGESSQMGNHSTYYTSSIYPSYVHLASS